MTVGVRNASLVSLLAAVVGLVASSAVVASASTYAGPETRVGANAPTITARVGLVDHVVAGRVGRATRVYDQATSAAGVVADRDASGRVVADRDGRLYRYDDAGRIAETVTATGERTVYEYDALGLLARERSERGDRRYEYDAAGRLVRSVDGTVECRYSYDAAGRRIAAVGSDGTAVTYEWDELGRLQRIRRAASDGSVRTVEIVGDALGRPVSIGESTIGWDDGGSGKPIRVGSERFLRHGPFVHAARAGGTWDAGVPDDPWGDDGGTGVRIGYRGELAFDELVFMGVRVYEPATRSFLSPDPLRAVPGARTYAGPYSYAYNDPVNQLDPSGEKPVSEAEYRDIVRRQEQTRYAQAWEAMVDDPWGTFAMVGITTIGVVMVATGYGAPVGVAILTAGGVTAVSGLASESFDPQQVALSEGIAGVTAGFLRVPILAGVSSTVPRQFVIGAAADGIGSATSQYLVTGHVDAGLVLIAAGIGGTASAGMFKIQSSLTAVRDIPGPTGTGVANATEAGGDLAVRQSYLAGEREIAELNQTLTAQGVPARDRALQLIEQRNVLRTQARGMMTDRAAADFLDATEPNLTLKQLASKAYAKGYRGDALWDYLADSASRSRASVSEAFGLDP